jgi:hypothetical protein
MFQDSDLQNAIIEYWGAQSVIIPAENAMTMVEEVRSKIKNNTREELMMALSELKATLASEEDISKAASFEFLMKKTNALINFIKSVKIGPVTASVYDRPVADLRAKTVENLKQEFESIVGGLYVKENLTKRGFMDKIKSMKIELATIDKELSLMDDYDPMKDKDGKMSELLNNQAVDSATSKEAELVIKARASKNPDAFQVKYNNTMDPKEVKAIEQAFGQNQWVMRTMNKDDGTSVKAPSLLWSRKRINYEMSKGRNLSGAITLQNYFDRMTLLTAKRISYLNAALQIKGRLQRLYNPSKMRLTAHLVREESASWAMAEPEYVKNSAIKMAEQLRDEQQALNKIITEEKLVDGARQEQLDSFLKIRAGENEINPQRWNALFAQEGEGAGPGLYRKPTFINEAMLLSPDMFSSFLTTSEDPDKEFRVESQLPKNLWNLPQGVDASDATENLDEGQATSKLGRKIYEFASSKENPEQNQKSKVWLAQQFYKLMRPYEGTVTKQDAFRQKSRYENDSEALLRAEEEEAGEYALDGYRLKKRLELARMPGLNWKYYLGLSIANIDRPSAETGHTQDPLKAYNHEINPPLVRLTLISSNPSVPDWILMRMAQHDPEQEIHDAAELMLHERGWRIVWQDAKKKIPKTSGSDWVWEKMRPRKKQSNFAISALEALGEGAPTTSMSDSDRLKQTQMQQEQRAREAEGQAEKAKEEKQQNEEKWQKNVGKKLSDKDQVTQPNPPQAPDTTRAIPGAKPSQLSPSYASLSIRDAAQEEHQDMKGSPNVYIEPGFDNVVRRAIDELNKVEPGSLNNITDVLISADQSSFGTYNSSSPNTIFINLHKIEDGVRQMIPNADATSFDKELMSQVMQTLAHEAGHQKAYTQSGTTAEGPAEEAEKRVRMDLKSKDTTNM